ncbi:MAG TPA: DEAD/DEAH box helicase family protein [Bryobacteraceae bacterium]|nr:DEAD/DEAH box helicase family protein [Bryobacteraceae bacterium]
MNGAESAQTFRDTPIPSGWEADGDLVAFVRDRLELRLGNYERIPDEVRDHHETELEALAGGYSYRQVLELVQNAADAILELNTAAGRIVLQLSENRLYAANTGAPLSKDGIIALLSARSSSKRQNQIGRFGIGFKSLLGLQGPIDVFSRSVCLRFDPFKCGQTIRERLTLAPDHPAPGLRLAWPTDSTVEFRSDPVLRQMAEWATTVIRIEIGEQRLVDHVSEELRKFPAEFLLFLPVDVNLELFVQPSLARTITRNRTGDKVKLVENDVEAPWQVVDIRVPLSDPEARSDATTVHTRDEVPISWALPLSAREDRGRFWAFFPTDTSSRIPGILNAPWKVNSDRTALIHGPYNTFLMNNAAKLIVAALPPLATHDDPARPLDMFPRELDSREEAARPLVDAVWDHLASVRVVADGKGDLRAPSDLILHPIEDDEAVRQWWQLASPEARRAFVHPNCYRGQRLNRLKYLLRRAKKKDDDHVPSLESWLEQVATPEPAQARLVFQLARQIVEGTNNINIRMLVRRAKAIPTTEGTLVPAGIAVIASGVVPAGKHAVHAEVAADKQCQQILDQVFGVKPLDGEQWRAVLEQALRAAQNSYGNGVAWVNFWSELRNAPQTVSIGLLGASSARVRVRNSQGKWVLASQVLRPGPVVDDHPNLASVVLDTKYHANDEPLLVPLKIQSEPLNELISWTGAIGDAFGLYEQAVYPRYVSMLSAKNKFPQSHLLNFIGHGKVQSGAPLLPLMPVATRGKLTALLLDRLNREALQRVSYGHTSRRDVYDPIEVPSPTCWLLAHFGVIELGASCVNIGDLVAARAFPWVALLPGWAAAIGRANNLLPAFFGEWPMPTGDLKSFWPAVFACCETSEVSTEVRKHCYEAGAGKGQAPMQVRMTSGLTPLKECYVTSSDALATQACKAGVSVIVLSSEASDVWCERGAKNLASIARIEHDGIAPDPLSLLDAAPEIAPALSKDSETNAFVLACKNLRIQIGGVETALPATLEAGKLLVDLEQLAKRSWQDRLTILVHEAINAGWIEGDTARVAHDIVQLNFIRRRADVAAKPSLDERLLAAVGGSTAAFLGTFDDAVRTAIERKAAMDPLAVARLALAVHGPTVLSALHELLENEGLQPPNRWGTQEAFEFAASLGFPPEFGGSRTARRAAEIWASGPMPLGALHDYQDRLIGQLGNLVAEHKTNPARAVLSLPTGSGKTRVAVETAVNCALSHGTSVLWIAQTDELCEQAVQSFRQVWANRGRPWTDLRIFRLWGGNPNPAAPDEDVPSVIVASIQTLMSRISGTLPDWVRDASLVVIDEAHHAIAPSYTRLLSWLIGKELDNRRTIPPPLLGLSATPFRGYNQEESRLLARRFDGRLYPAPDEQGGLYQKLQADGILSEILVEPLKYDAPFVLTEAEIEQIETFAEFPDGAAQRMGQDQERNDAIVRAVSGYADKGQVLLFANSVWHATHLAALLQLKGVQAAAVHGGTETSARQYFIREFQKSKIKVLCNYGVLTTGFDAPKTDVIVISRPVFSPVRYMQMVGRGLRGLKNGGTATCRVVTVLDNIVQYSDRLAYHSYFTPYYQQ